MYVVLLSFDQWLIKYKMLIFVLKVYIHAIEDFAIISSSSKFLYTAS